MKLSDKIEFWGISLIIALMNGAIFSYSLIQLMNDPGTDLAKFFAFGFLFLYFGGTVAAIFSIYEIENDEF